MPSKIEDYAILGDCETCALIARNGSIDWLCWPRFDSAACFGALLGGPENGRWIIAPQAPVRRATRRYRGETLILETEIETGDGILTLVEFMPPRGNDSHLVRLVVGKRGTVSMRTELVLRFDHGSMVPWVTRGEDGEVCAVCGPDMVMLRTPVPLHGEHRKTIGEFSVAAGETVSFVLTYSASHLDRPAPIDPLAALADTESFWQNWLARFDGADEWRKPVIRSLITLKALTYRPTGGIVAAATT